MDNAATTALNKEVLDAMMPYLTDIYGNPSSLHTFGQEAHKAVADAREKVARALNAADAEKEIIFTGCGTESDNMVLRGIAERLSKKGKHIITTAVEHHAVLYTCRYLEKQGFEVTYLPVDEFGRVTAEQIREAIRPDTILVSVMFGNNEIGTLMPIAEIGAICRERGVLFHTDAVQAVGHVHIDVRAMNIDMLSLSAHKFHGPKGVGALYVRKGILLPSLLIGGAQERNRRAGTENVAGIVGLGKAIELACSSIDETSARMTRLRDKLIAGIEARIPEVRQRASHRKAAGQCQFLHQIHRRRIHPSHARPERYCGIQRLRLHKRLTRPESCSACDRPPARNCTRFRATHPRGRHNRRRC